MNAMHAMHGRDLCSKCGVRKRSCDRYLCPYLERVTPLQVFAWAVTRQSDLGPGVTTAAEALNTSPEEVREAVRAWRDNRGHMELAPVRGHRNAWRIEAYYNTSG